MAKTTVCSLLVDQNISIYVQLKLSLLWTTPILLILVMKIAGSHNGVFSWLRHGNKTAGEKEEIPHHQKKTKNKKTPTNLNPKVQLNVSDEFLFMPEHHQTQPTTKKKGLIFVTASLQAPGWTTHSPWNNTQGREREVLCAQKLSQVTQKQEGMQAEPTCKARCWQQLPWAASDGAASSSPGNTNPLSCMSRTVNLHNLCKAWFTLLHSKYLIATSSTVSDSAF